jgi:hypothetical protein
VSEREQTEAVFAPPAARVFRVRIKMQKRHPQGVEPNSKIACKFPLGDKLCFHSTLFSFTHQCFAAGTKAIRAPAAIRFQRQKGF